MAKETIFQRYKLTLFMIPAIIAMHMGWNSMQYNRSLVTASEQIDLPIVTFGKYCWRKITGAEEPKE